MSLTRCQNYKNAEYDRLSCEGTRLEDINLMLQSEATWRFVLNIIKLQFILGTSRNRWE